MNLIGMFVSGVCAGIMIGVFMESRLHLQTSLAWKESNDRWFKDMTQINARWHRYATSLERRLAELETEGEEWKQA